MTSKLTKCKQQVDGLMQNMRNSIADALELRLFWVKPSLYPFSHVQ